MRSTWYSFIDEYKEHLPYKPLSIILEAFYWYGQMNATIDDAFIMSCKEKIYKLIMD